MTPEENYTKLKDNLEFNIHNEDLRKEVLAFVESGKNRLLTSPASSAVSKHHAYPGGLVAHINEVINLGLIFLQDVSTFTGPSITSQAIEDFVLAAALHDIHKIGDPFGRAYYEPNMVKASKRKDETQMKQSTAKPYAINDLVYKFASVANASTRSVADRALAMAFDRNVDALPEGELSLLFINATQPSLYVLLNDSVKFAVRYHDGAYQSGAKFQLAGKETPVMLALHFADMVSSRKPKWLNVNEEPTEE